MTCSRVSQKGGRASPHGAEKGDHIASRGRNLVSRLHKMYEGIPAYRKFNGQVFRLQTIQPSIKEANYFIEEYKDNFFIRKVRVLRNGGSHRDYAVYVRSKSARRGQ